MAINPFQNFMVRYGAGERIFTEGDLGTTMYIVQSGKVRLFRLVEGQKRIHGMMEKGDFFGEMSILEGLPRTMSAEAVEDSELIEINSMTFDKMIKGNIEIAMARQQQAETAMYVTQRTVERQVVEQALTYQTKLTEMAKWRPESVGEFRKAAELADRHYRLGAVPITTYVELQRQYLDAIEALLDTQREALDAGQQLELLTGLDIRAGRSTP